MINTMIGMPGTAEMLIILAIVILVFGAAKLPELARSSGQALRIFKTETKGLRDDDKAESEKIEAEREIEARNEAERQARSEASGEVLRERRDDTTA
jgi:sec-independent protein translocase protein TatA